MCLNDLQWAKVGSISNKLHSMVDGNVIIKAAAIKHSSRVAAPVRGIKSNGQGPDIGDVLHYGHLIVGGEGVVASEADHGGHGGQVVVAVAADHGVSGHVGPVFGGHGPEQLEIIVAELGHGALAAACAAAAERVGGAGGDLLGGQLGQLSGADEGVRLNLGRKRERLTRIV